MDRLYKKKALVEVTASRLMVGMVKGTIKYPHDDWTPKEWLAHMFDEQYDLLNYIALYEESVKHGQVG